MLGTERVRLSSLTLTVSEKCNLRCSYCYVPFERGRSMSPEVARKAVDLLAEHAADGEVTLSFFGGEPLLSLDLCRSAVEQTRRAVDGKRRLRVLLPTNATLLDEAALAWCRDEDVEVAVSIDGDAKETERRDASGRPVAAELTARAAEISTALPKGRLMARMTVTPANVERLSTNVRALARLGFRRVVYLMAYEEPWNDEAIAAFGREHRRIGTWLVGAHGAGANVPDLPAWRAIEERLLLGKGRQACGAGRRIAAVSTDGGLYPCYRLVFRGDDSGVRLGDVDAGFTGREALERFAAFDPNDVRPEQGSCASCAAADGCTHACPALGWTMLGDVRAVPAVACRLMREQVAAIRPYAAVRPVRRAPLRTASALMLAAVAATAASTACGGETDATGQTHAGGFTGTAGDSGLDALPDAFTGGFGGGGICPVFVDASEDVASGGTGGAAGYGGGGVCPIEIDAGEDAATGGVAGMGGGLCPYSGGGGGVC